MTKRKPLDLPPVDALRRTHGTIHSYNVPTFSPDVQFTVHTDCKIGRRTAVHQIFDPQGNLLYTAKNISEAMIWLRERDPKRIAIVNDLYVDIAEMIWLPFTPEQ